MEGLNTALDLTGTTNHLANQFNYTEEEAARAGKDAGDLFTTGWGESIDQVGEALGAVESSMADFGSVSDDTLKELTKDAIALSDTFEFDVAETTQAAGNLIKAGLAKDGTAAFDLLTAAAQKLPPKLREELPALTNEYSEFFRQLGFTGPQMFGVLAQAAQNPTFELDKLGDAFKEFTLRLSDPGAIKDTMTGIGLDVEHIQTLFNTGKGTEAFDQVIAALKDTDDATTRTMAQAALFGGPGEDLGNSLLQISAGGAAAATGMDQAAGSAAKVASSMENSPAQQWDSAMRTVSTTIGEALLPVLKVVNQFLKDNPGLIEAVTPVVLALAAALAVWAAVQWVLNSALLANPITWIILGVVALIAAIVLIATKTTWFQDAWHAMATAVAAAWDWLWGLLKDGWKLLEDLFLNWTGPGLLIKHWDTIKAAVASAISWVVDTVRGGVAMVSGWIDTLASIPGRVGEWFSNIGDKIASPFRAGFSSVARYWNSTVGGFSFSIPSWVPVIGGKSWSIPDIPQLADGGIVSATPGGVLATIGEGGQDEAVIPLDRLDGMLRSVAGAVARTTGTGSSARVVIDVTGADSEFRSLIQRIVRTDGRGSVQTAFGQ